MIFEKGKYPYETHETNNEREETPADHNVFRRWSVDAPRRKKGVAGSFRQPLS